MQDMALRLLIRSKLSDGHLPHDRIPHVWGGPGNNETCGACSETISKAQVVIEAMAAAGGEVQLHVKCFHLWDSERQVPGDESSDTGRLPGDGAGATPATDPQKACDGQASARPHSALLGRSFRRGGM